MTSCPTISSTNDENGISSNSRKRAKPVLSNKHLIELLQNDSGPVKKPKLENDVIKLENNIDNETKESVTIGSVSDEMRKGFQKALTECIDEMRRELTYLLKRLDKLQTNGMNGMNIKTEETNEQ